MSIKERKLRNLKKQIAILNWELRALAKAIPTEDWAVVFGKLEDSHPLLPRKVIDLPTQFPSWRTKVFSEVRGSSKKLKTKLKAMIQD